MEFLVNSRFSSLERVSYLRSFNHFLQFQSHLTMQLTIRGQESYLLDFNGDETFAELKTRVCEQEKTEVLLYVSGKPLPEEGLVSSIENCAVDVTVPLLGGKVRQLIH